MDNHKAPENQFESESQMCSEFRTSKSCPQCLSETLHEQMSLLYLVALQHYKHFFCADHLMLLLKE